MNPTSNKHDLEQIFNEYGKIVDIWVSLRTVFNLNIIIILNLDLILNLIIALSNSVLNLEITAVTPVRSTRCM